MRALRVVALAVALGGAAIAGGLGGVATGAPPRLSASSSPPPAYRSFVRSVGGSRFVPVDGSLIHYVEAGPRDRPTVLLLHGSPDNLFTWRHIMPRLAAHLHVLAPDLIGFGLSGRPRVAYTWSSETRYLTGFIDALHLHHITIVATDIGALFAFTYSREHTANVAGLAIFETILGPLSSYAELARICGSCTQFFSGPKQHPQSLISDSHLAADIYGSSLLHRPSSRDLAGFAFALSTPAERRVVTSIGAQMPIGGQPADNARTAAANLHWLQHSRLPKLVMYADPSFVLPRRVILARHLRAAVLADVGAGYHYLAEDAPNGIVHAVLAWRSALGRAQQ